MERFNLLSKQHLNSAFFHGWFIRVVDFLPIQLHSTDWIATAPSLNEPTSSLSENTTTSQISVPKIAGPTSCFRSISIIIGAYNPKQPNASDPSYTEHYLCILFVDSNGKLNTFSAFPNPSCVRVTICNKDWLYTSDMSQSIFQSWESTEHGYINIHGDGSAKFDLTDGKNIRVAGYCAHGKSWSQKIFATSNDRSETISQALFFYNVEKTAANDVAKADIATPLIGLNESELNRHFSMDSSHPHTRYPSDIVNNEIPKNLLDPHNVSNIDVLDQSLRHLLTKVGSGPESWLKNIAFILPCRYVVNFLNAQAQYEIKDIRDNAKKAGNTFEYKGQGFAHCENNWGHHFPRGWIWAQGTISGNGLELCHETYKFDMRSTSYMRTFVLAGVLLKTGSTKIFAWTVAYRSPKVAWDFSTPELADIKHYDHSNGRSFKLIAKSRVPFYKRLLCKQKAFCRTLEIEINAAPSSFEPVLAPDPAGFFHQSFGCLESHTATTRVTAYLENVSNKRQYLLETSTIPATLMEYGGFLRFCDSHSSGISLYTS